MDPFSTSPMSQSIFMYVGAVVGALVWLLFRKALPLPNVFLCIVDSAWLGVLLFAMVRGELTLGGRGGRSPKTFTGVKARAIAIAIFLFLASLTASFIEIKH